MKLAKQSLVILTTTLILLAGCSQPQPQWSEAALQQQTGTGVQVRPSDVGMPQTASVEYIRVKTETSIFLDPPEDNMNVHLRVGDTSGRDWGDLSIRDLVAQELGNRGYNVVTNAKNAAYSLQVNILLADAASGAEIAQLDETKYGQDVSSIAQSALAGAAIGGIGSGLAGGDMDAVAVGAVGGAVLGGVLKGLSNSRKKKLLIAQQQTKFFSFITDVVVSERVKGGVHDSDVVRQYDDLESSQNNDVYGVNTGSDKLILSTKVQTYEGRSPWRRHHSRMIGKAKGKLVVFEDVQKDFAVKMARAIAGFF